MDITTAGSGSINGSQAASGEQVVNAGQTIPGDMPGSQFTQQTGPSASALKDKWAADRAARGTKVEEAVLGGERGEHPELEAPDVNRLMEQARERRAKEAEARGETPEATADDGSVVTDPAAGEATPGAEPAAAGAPTRMERIQAARDAAKRASASDKARRVEISRLQAERESLRARSTQLEQQARRGQSLEQSLRADPLSALKNLGLTPEQLVQRALNDGTPESKIEALAEALKASEAKAEAREKALAQQRAAIEREAKNTAFVEAAKNPAKYPNLEGFGKRELLALGYDVVSATQQYYRERQEAVPPGLLTDQAILKHLDKRLGKSKKTTSAEPPKAAVPPKAAKPTGTSKPKPESPRTATNSMSSGTFSRPADFSSLPRSKRIEMLTAGYRRQG